LFDSVNFTSLSEGVQPHFHCPVCGQDHTKRFWFQPKVSFPPTVPPIFDFNQQVSFGIPRHNDASTGKRCGGSGKKITLYVAVHGDETRLLLCISVDLIPLDWWITRYQTRIINTVFVQGLVK